MKSSPAGLSHMVYFKLVDASQSKIDSLLAACKKYLSDHPGTLHFSVGSRNLDLEREVNDCDYHVALNLIFENLEAHDAYQVADRHNQFIEEQKDNWKAVRVFDSDLV